MSGVSITGQAGVDRMLDEYAPGPRQNLERKAVRAGAKVIGAVLSGIEAGRRPASFARMAPVKVSTHGEAGMEVYALVRPKSPLWNILEPGARRHTIVPGEKGRNSYRPSRPYATKATLTGRTALAGRPGGSEWPAEHSEAGRDRAHLFYSSGPVEHPGLRGRGDAARAASSGGRAAQDAMAAVIFQAGAAGGRP